MKQLEELLEEDNSLSEERISQESFIIARRRSRGIDSFEPRRRSSRSVCPRWGNRASLDYARS